MTPEEQQQESEARPKPNRRHDDRPKTLKERAADVVFKQGFSGLVAAVLLWILVGVLKDKTGNEAKIIEKAAETQQETLNELRIHANETNWLMRQICINSAVQAGTPRELCEPPRNGNGR